MNRYYFLGASGQLIAINENESHKLKWYLENKEFIEITEREWLKRKSEGFNQYCKQTFHKDKE